MRTDSIGHVLLAAVAGTMFAVNALGAPVPAPGTSPRIDAIVKSGKLRVGVITNPPWLIENTSGTGEQWAGPAWVLAKRIAADLRVTLQPVPVSHETKVPALASNQLDITITPLAVSPERMKVIDFILFSNTSVCMYGLAANAKLATAKSVDDLNDPKFTIAYLIGAPEEAWTKERFPKAKLRGVISSSPTPIEEIMTARSDVAPVNRIQWPKLSATVKNLRVLPTENNCQNSNEKAAGIGYGIDRGQDVYRDWLQSVANEMKQELQAVEQEVIKTRM